MTRTLMKLRRRLAGDGGFTLVEAMVSITILAVGAFAIAQSMMFGLGSTGLSRQRLASRDAPGGATQLPSGRRFPVCERRT